MNETVGKLEVVWKTACDGSGSLLQTSAASIRRWWFLFVSRLKSTADQPLLWPSRPALFHAPHDGLIIYMYMEASGSVQALLNARTAVRVTAATEHSDTFAQRCTETVGVRHTELRDDQHRPAAIEVRAPPGCSRATLQKPLLGPSEARASWSASPRESLVEPQPCPPNAACRPRDG